MKNFYDWQISGQHKITTREDIVALQPIQQTQRPIGRDLLEIAMGVFSPSALQVLRFSEAATASPTIPAQGKAVAQIAGGLAVLYFFIKLGEAFDD